MSENNRSDKALERARACLETYGADLARWPAAERASLGPLLDADALKADVANAAELDAAFAAADSPAMSADLERRLLADFDAVQSRKGSVGDAARKFFAMFSMGPERLAPAGAAACAAALGLTLGDYTTGSAALTPEAEALALFEDALVLAEFSEEGEGLWDAE